MLQIPDRLSLRATGMGARGLRSEFERLITPLLLKDHSETRQVMLDADDAGEPVAICLKAEKAKEQEA